MTIFGSLRLSINTGPSNAIPVNMIAIRRFSGRFPGRFSGRFSDHIFDVFRIVTVDAILKAVFRILRFFVVLGISTLVLDLQIGIL